MQTTVRLVVMVAAVAAAAVAGFADVRSPAVAGGFYERLPVALEVQVDGLLRAAPSPAVTGRLVAAVAPHAGYVFSGRCAAGVYRLLTTGEIDRVIILAPSHRAAFAGVALPDAALTAYRTPLGDVPVDRAVCNALRGTPGFTQAAGADRLEHAIEVHLPLLQRAAGSFRLIPLLCGAMDADAVAAVAGALAAHMGTGTLLVASSDFTHYGPNYEFVPFTDHRETALKAWLSEAASRVAALDLAGFDRHCRETRDTICGRNPIRVLMAALQNRAPAVRGQVLGLATSGDVAGDYENSVSYAAIGFFEPGGSVTPDPGPAAYAANPAAKAPVQLTGGTMTNQAGAVGQDAFRLTDASQKRLLEIARQSIESYLKTGKAVRVDVPEGELTTPGAVFVTLTQKGQLRGCIGTTEPREPLHLAVAHLAVAAAVEDNRFPTLTIDELPRTHIEISVLSPMRRVKSAVEIREHEHGVLVRRGWRSGLFLPQVWEHFSTKEDFLNELCRQKAHLDAGAWKDPATELLVFTVFAFEEPAR